MVKKDVKIISKKHLLNTVKLTHILHANSYPRFSSVSHVMLLSILFAKFVNSADYVGRNGMSNFFGQMFK